MSSFFSPHPVDMKDRILHLGVFLDRHMSCYICLVFYFGSVCCVCNLPCVLNLGMWCWVCDVLGAADPSLGSTVWLLSYAGNRGVYCVVCLCVRDVVWGFLCTVGLGVCSTVWDLPCIVDHEVYCVVWDFPCIVGHEVCCVLGVSFANPLKHYIEVVFLEVWFLAEVAHYFVPLRGYVCYMCSAS